MSPNKNSFRTMLQRQDKYVASIYGTTLGAAPEVVAKLEPLFESNRYVLVRKPNNQQPKRRGFWYVVRKVLGA